MWYSETEGQNYCKMVSFMHYQYILLKCWGTWLTRLPLWHSICIDCYSFYIHSSVHIVPHLIKWRRGWFSWLIFYSLSDTTTIKYCLLSICFALENTLILLLKIKIPIKYLEKILKRYLVFLLGNKRRRERNERNHLVQFTDLKAEET